MPECQFRIDWRVNLMAFRNNPLVWRYAARDCLPGRRRVEQATPTGDGSFGDTGPIPGEERPPEKVREAGWPGSVRMPTASAPGNGLKRPLSPKRRTGLIIRTRVTAVSFRQVRRRNARQGSSPKIPSRLASPASGETASTARSVTGISSTR